MDRFSQNRRRSRSVSPRRHEDRDCRGDRSRSRQPPSRFRDRQPESRRDERRHEPSPPHRRDRDRQPEGRRGERRHESSPPHRRERDWQSQDRRGERRHESSPFHRRDRDRHSEDRRCERRHESSPPHRRDRDRQSEDRRGERRHERDEKRGDYSHCWRDRQSPERRCPTQSPTRRCDRMKETSTRPPEGDLVGLQRPRFGSSERGSSSVHGQRDADGREGSKHYPPELPGFQSLKASSTAGHGPQGGVEVKATNALSSTTSASGKAPSECDSPSRWSQSKIDEYFALPTVTEENSMECTSTPVEKDTLASPLSPCGSSPFKMSSDDELSEDFEKPKRQQSKARKKALPTFAEFKCSITSGKKSNAAKVSGGKPKAGKSSVGTIPKPDNDIVFIDDDEEEEDGGRKTRSAKSSTRNLNKSLSLNHKEGFKYKWQIEKELETKEKEIQALKVDLNKKPTKETGLVSPSSSSSKTPPFLAPPPPKPNRRKPNRDLLLQQVLFELGGAVNEEIAKSIIDNEIVDVAQDAVSWESIAGLEKVKEHLKGIVVVPLIRPDIYQGLRAPEKGVLLFGPPGTGKTLIGKCLAAQANATFFSISASSITSKWMGDGERRIKCLFQIAGVLQPSIIFIDEIDSLLSSRDGGKDNECTSRIKTEFLTSHDGVRTSGNDRVLLIGATNLPHKLDQAARRRFSSRLYIPLPDVEARKELFRTHLNKERHSLSDEDIGCVADASEGYSGADLYEVLKAASKAPVAELTLDELRTIPADSIRAIALADVMTALAARRPSVSPKDLKELLAFKRQFGTMI